MPDAACVGVVVARSPQPDPRKQVPASLGSGHAHHSSSFLFVHICPLSLYGSSRRQAATSSVSSRICVASETVKRLCLVS